MAKKEPKTEKGIERKLMTNDGRKKTEVEKGIERMDKSVNKAISTKKKK